MLLLANSSFALEVITHDGHGHSESVAELEMSEMDSHVNHEIDSQFNHTGHDQATVGQADDDCICDEICCVSSTDFGSAVTAGQHPDFNSTYQKLSDLYASVSLDLLLQPPTD